MNPDAIANCPDYVHAGKTWKLVGRDRTRAGWLNFLFRVDEHGQGQKTSVFIPNRKHELAPAPNAGPRAGRDRSGRIRR